MKRKRQPEDRKTWVVLLEPLTGPRCCVLDQAAILEPFQEEFEAETASLAVKAVEKMHPHHVARMVGRCIAGKCHTCGQIMFDGEPMRKMREGGILCEACR